MPSPFTHTTHPPGYWLAALVISLVLWGMAYAQASAPAASPANREARYFFTAGRGRLQRWLLNDADNAVALHQLAASPAGTVLPKAAQLAPSREPSPPMVAANTGPNARLAGPK